MAWLIVFAGRAAWAGDLPRLVAPFVPDSASIERYGPAYRFPQAGWIVLHIEGAPYERGVQHGRLMAPEIAEIVRAAAVNQSPKAPEDGWNQMRLLVDALFLRRYDEELLIEMRGIADGAAAAGARFDGRPLDLVDIVAINAWTEVEFLEAAMRATPHGLEGMKHREFLPTPVKAPPPERCSSFIATGPATADGNIVFGHITMWSLQPARHFNVWLDLQPDQGHRMVMQSYAGGIQSSMDFYMNSAGLLVSETTITQTRFNVEGKAEASRIRKAVQYGSSIDQVVDILKTSNNGLYSNEWLIGDTKTNEIAMFELGTFKSRIWRSSRGEWFGDTPGFYWGCNNTKDLEVRLEAVPSVVGRPVNVVFRPSDRDLMWQRLYAKHRGKIDARFGFEAFTTPPLAAAHSLDAKVTTAEMARNLEAYALFGPPLGRTWEPSDWDRQRYGDQIRPLVSNGWTLLQAGRTSGVEPIERRRLAVDLASSEHRADFRGRRRAPAPASSSGHAWHGTILPATDGDVWLAAGFADYERIVAQEMSWGGRADYTSLPAAAADPTNLAMSPYRSRYLLAARALPDTSLSGVRRSVTSNGWYDLAAGKGIYVLAELNNQLGDSKFLDLMDSFGREFGGKEASTADFRARAENVAGHSLDWFFDQWTGTPHDPRLLLSDVKVSTANGDWHVHGVIDQEVSPVRARLEIVVETTGSPVTHVVELGNDRRLPFELSVPARPRRLIVDPFNRLLKSNGSHFTVQSFETELEQSMIVCGTGSERTSHREAAELLQRRLASQWSNISVPIKLDRDLTDRDINSKHLLLIGRPSQNSLTDRFQSLFRVKFGLGSFSILDQVFAHPASSVVVVAPHPSSGRHSIVLFAGLSAESTRRVAATATSPCDVIVWSAGAHAQPLVLPDKALMVEFPGD